MQRQTLENSKDAFADTKTPSVRVRQHGKASIRRRYATSTTARN
jgi:hypothetical protein